MLQGADKPKACAAEQCSTCAVSRKQSMHVRAVLQYQVGLRVRVAPPLQDGFYHTFTAREMGVVIIVNHRKLCMVMNASVMRLLRL